MFLSQKRKSISPDSKSHLTPGLEKILEIIVHKCVCTQRRLADAMQKKSQQLSVTGKKVALITFCFIGIAASIYAFTEDIFDKSNRAHFKISPIAISKNVLEENDRTSNILFDSEFNKIEQFKKYIDSLSNSISGQKIKDSILKFRPLIMDSINQFEKLYLNKTDK
jgi:hypothetical protein